MEILALLICAALANARASVDQAAAATSPPPQMTCGADRPPMKLCRSGDWVNRNRSQVLVDDHTRGAP